MAAPEPDWPSVACTLGDALRRLTGELAQAGVEGAGGDVRRLASKLLGISGAELLRTPERVLTAAELQLLHEHVRRRRLREPVSRILGERDFYGRTFAISPATLDPRPDSETLIVAALDIAREERWLGQPLHILDFGTGSGCLLLTLLCELPEATGLGTDISGAAIEIAAGNARRLGVERRAEWIEANGLESIRGRFHMLVANPPYVRSADISGLEPEVRDYDPIQALDGGSDGLSFYRDLARCAACMVPGGWMVLEVGHDQADSVAALLAGAGIDPRRIRVRKDVAGKRRCVAAKTLG